MFLQNFWIFYFLLLNIYNLENGKSRPACPWVWRRSFFRRSEALGGWQTAVLHKYRKYHFNRSSPCSGEKPEIPCWWRRSIEISVASLIGWSSVLKFRAQVASNQTDRYIYVIIVKFFGRISGPVHTTAEKCCIAAVFQRSGLLSTLIDKGAFRKRSSNRGSLKRRVWALVRMEKTMVLR